MKISVVCFLAEHLVKRDLKWGEILKFFSFLHSNILFSNSLRLAQKEHILWNAIVKTFYYIFVYLKQQVSKNTDFIFYITNSSTKPVLWGLSNATKYFYNPNFQSIVRSGFLHSIIKINRSLMRVKHKQLGG